MQIQKKKEEIKITGARQNNLKNINVSFDYNKFTVVTGVSGSGKSSLVFDTLYAEGQRRYVETFSPYVRQFMDRMDRPHVEKIEGVPPAIAIDQTNPVRTSRSTVGTMTEINDHLKMLFAQTGTLYCRKCGHEVREENPQSIYSALEQEFKNYPENTRYYVCFSIDVPKDFPVEDVVAGLSAQGYTHINVPEGLIQGPAKIEVIAGRFKASTDKSRFLESLESALLAGKGHIYVRSETPDGEKLKTWKFSDQFSCSECEITYNKPHASTFSFNSPLGACEVCKGFGKVIGIDYGLVIPDTSKSLREGAVKPWTTASFEDCQKELLEYAQNAGIDIDKPYRELSKKEQKWVLEGDPKWTSFRSKKWYGVKHFFEWLETKSYKMHVRVMLSRYRGYSECPSCNGARLKPDSQLWRIGSKKLADNTLKADSTGKYTRFRPVGSTFSEKTLQSLPGLSMHDIMLLPIERLKKFFDELQLTPEQEKTCDLLLKEIRNRFSYLVEVGLGYLTLDRQSRTLSGGEVQRINLTTALGTSLVNTLFVLDEPSIGLHPQDMDRVNSVMRKLKDAGNTLVVVEHDPQVMLAADRIIDMGPGPGAEGGTIVFDGTPEEIKQSKGLTGKYLSGKLKINKRKRKKVNPAGDALVLLGAKEHNLKDLDIRIPLQHLVCIAGVSGSGKSTLIQDILVPALRQEKGQPTEAPGMFESLIGADKVDDVVFVDQTPIGKTTRSNPALFVGAFDTIRSLFAAAPLSVQRRYTPGTFSFNSGTGRCPTCEGAGYTHEEMQFLSDVYIKCPDCDGKRYRQQTLDVKLFRMGRELNIAEVLDLTVKQALDFFCGNESITKALTPLVKVGLDYLKLGQPVPTLSGGEAQRLKLAKYLAEASEYEHLEKNKLFVFDEPTTGLHFDDTAKLMGALRELVDNGNSVVVVEHNLDVIDGSDWIIELGPEGGDKGGKELFAGTPDHFVIKETPTGKALASYRAALKAGNPTAYFVDMPEVQTSINPYPSDAISIVHAREHNLKNLSLSIPRNKFTVVTGVSGSGKSTLAFDLIFNEGQRRYLDSLNAFARSMVQPASRPDVDAIYGIPPTVAIEQRTSRGGQKSTVATLTEIYHFLRLIYLKLGVQYCPDCQIPVQPQSPEAILNRISEKYRGQEIMITAPVVRNRKGTYREVGARAHARGFKKMIVDGEIVSTYRFPELDRFKEHNLDLVVSELAVSYGHDYQLEKVLAVALDYGKGVVEVHFNGEIETFSVNRSCPNCETSFPQLDPRLFSYNSSIGWCPSCQGYGLGVFQDALNKEEVDEKDTATLKASANCTECNGTRLNRVARNVLFYEKSITDISCMTVLEAEAYFKDLAQAVKADKREDAIASEAIKEILSRLSFLKEVGLSYLSLNRSAPTLSGGEAQRIRLASQLGTNLQGVCYVLDEPTIGLHPRDNKMLLSALDKLADKGNSLIVVEHDEDTIRRADHVIDIGPGAGARGGQLILNGTVEELIENADKSLTGKYLKEPLQHSGKAPTPTKAKDPVVEVKGAFKNNLKVKSVKFPLNRLTVVTGVSGSGKSTLSREVLLKSLKNAVDAGKDSKIEFVGCKDLLGFESVDRVLEVDQTPIGKTPRSCPATYVGFWDQIRKLFAGTNEAKARGYNNSRFSFNVAAGRCPDCNGQGYKTVEMSFLPDVRVNCETCNSMRFNDETLAVTWKGKNIGEVLKMDVDEAVEFFASQPSIAHPLKLMKDVGLGYLTLGQPSPTLSGGEAQRIKLVSELTKVKDDITLRGRKPPHTFYVLDEPTVGLHMADVDKLIKVLQRLVKAGNTVVVIEHNLDVMAEADWIIDMGPEGGEGGGNVVFAGPPETLVKQSTYTAEALKEFLNR